MVCDANKNIVDFEIEKLEIYFGTKISGWLRDELIDLLQSSPEIISLILSNFGLSLTEIIYLYFKLIDKKCYEPLLCIASVTKSSEYRNMFILILFFLIKQESKPICSYGRYNNNKKRYLNI